MNKKPNIHTTFNHEHFVRLRNFSPEQAEEYRQSFTIKMQETDKQLKEARGEKKDEMAEKDELVAFLRNNGVSVAGRHWKLETLQRKVAEINLENSK
tara:strand:+ start:380 stop:670 length:291 start_codon:yes stop_codon:yes gene_type:complete